MDTSTIKNTYSIGKLLKIAIHIFVGFLFRFYKKILIFSNTNVT